ncbi:TPA: hypothetical protein UMZ04_001128 [Stenotrophomonas maltophilia]|jgi:hypothetical protein|nr:hypothetical protein [Stenotrophomonas maltophilia]HEL3845524.1 hypothetical protein [Stenotrophomonas maltophilia]HEL4292555.1 hypothetical protein [Stenotrophomonas maltophilia]
MSSTTKTILMYAVVSTLAVLFFVFPDVAFADGGSAVRGKLDSARSSYALPIAGGIIALGAVGSVVMWALDLVDWKSMVKWIVAAILVGAIAGIAIEMMS